MLFPTDLLETYIFGANDVIGVARHADPEGFWAEVKTMVFGYWHHSG